MVIQLALQQVGWLSLTKPSSMILMRFSMCYVIYMIDMIGLIYGLCDLCDGFFVQPICVVCYMCLICISMILQKLDLTSSVYVICYQCMFMFYSVYENMLCMCSLTHLRVCRSMLLDITLHAGTLPSRPMYQNSGYSI